MSKHTIPPSAAPDQLELPCFPAPRGGPRDMDPAIPWHIVLVDFENAQPKNVAALAGLPVKVCVFVGTNQSKINLDFAAFMQQLGDNATYVRMAGSGRNALDFHIACYLGEMAAAEPDAHYYIVSKDKGFDPLVRHLNERDVRPIRVRRVHGLETIPALRHANVDDLEARIDTIVTGIVARASARPKRVKTLSNSINALFAKQLHAEEVAVLVDALQDRGYIAVNGSKVSYVSRRSP